MRIGPALTSLLTAVAIYSIGHAATVTHVGNDVDATGPDWRTPSVVKPFDVDGDNIYGTDGWIRPTGFTPTVANPSYLTASWIAGGDFAGGTSVADDAAGGADVAVREMFDGSPPTLTDFIQIDMTAAGDFRIGVMADYRFNSPVNGFTESPFGIQVRQTIGGAGDSTLIAAPVKNGEFDYMFFDVIGAAAGDQFIVTSERDPGWIETTLSHTFFDTIPEPSAPLLAALGALGLILRRRR